MKMRPTLTNEKPSAKDSAIVPNTAGTDKAFAGLAARFALAGHSLVRTASGSYYAMRWGQIKPLASLDDARRFLAQIGGDQ